MSNKIISQIITSAVRRAHKARAADEERTKPTQERKRIDLADTSLYGSAVIHVYKIIIANAIYIIMLASAITLYTILYINYTIYCIV